MNRRMRRCKHLDWEPVDLQTTDDGQMVWTLQRCLRCGRVKGNELLPGESILLPVDIGGET